LTFTGDPSIKVQKPWQKPWCVVVSIFLSNPVEDS
jgi:hypothetical protein